MIVFLQRVPISTLLYSIPFTALFLAGLDGIYFALGVRGANFIWTDPRHVVDEIAGYLGYIVDIAYLLVSLLLFIAPVFLLPRLGISEESGRLVGLLVGSTFTLLCMILPLMKVENQVYRMGEG